MLSKFLAQSKCRYPGKGRTPGRACCQRNEPHCNRTSTCIHLLYCLRCIHHRMSAVFGCCIMCSMTSDWCLQHAHLTKDSCAIQLTTLGICLLLSRKPPKRMDSSTARLPRRLAAAVEGAAAPMDMFMDAPTCSHAHLGKHHTAASIHFDHSLASNVAWHSI